MSTVAPDGGSTDEVDACDLSMWSTDLILDRALSAYPDVRTTSFFGETLEIGGNWL